MSEEALRQRRALRGRRRPAREQPGGLTAEQRELIATLLAAHQRTFDSSFAQFTHYWVSRGSAWGGVALCHRRCHRRHPQARR